MQKILSLFFLFFVVLTGGISKSVASTKHGPVDNRLLNQEGKQIGQEYASTSESLQSNQALAKYVDCLGGSQALERERNSAVICQACMKFCCRCKRRNFNFKSAGLF